MNTTPETFATAAVLVFYAGVAIGWVAVQVRRYYRQRPVGPTDPAAVAPPTVEERNDPQVYGPLTAEECDDPQVYGPIFEDITDQTTCGSSTAACGGSPDRQRR
jgi:hypothetical protein